jgi:translation elongation factor EF-Tu-like GTPase
MPSDDGAHRRVVVEDTFLIEGGLVLVPGFDAGRVTVRPGDEVVILRPDGTQLFAAVHGVSLVRLRSGEAQVHVLLRDVAKADVPKGSVVTCRSRG